MSRRHAAVLVLLAAFGLTACETGERTDPQPAAIIRTEPAPDYVTVAASHNLRVARLESLWARTVVRIKYVDERKQQREEQGEGLLQVVRPSKLAMSIKKAGQMLFWFGGDDTRYWLFDVIDKPLVRVGRHDLIRSRSREAGLGLDINPREIIRLLGISPLPTDGGTSRWSSDGRSVEIRTGLVDGGAQVLSMDPQTLLPVKISLTDPKGVELVSASLDQYEPVEIANHGGVRPRIASRVTATHPASKTEIKIDLSEMRNSGVSEMAFDYEKLKAQFVVEQVIDLDARPSARQ